MLNQIKSELRPLIGTTDNTRFFKNSQGHYAEHDLFLGIKVPDLRKISKQFFHLKFSELKTLLHSQYNEERLLALLILVEKFSREDQESALHFYLENISQVNNWNLVDSSSYPILGAYLFDRDRTILIDLAHSPNLWERRIAIVTTYYFIKKGDLEWTWKIAALLLNDREDLIHKACGWMLREAGKKDEKLLLAFIEKHTMPRTMLRYAIEKLPKDKQKLILARQ